MKKVINKVIAIVATAVMAMGTITCVGASISEANNTKLMHMNKTEYLIPLGCEDQFFADENGFMTHHAIVFYNPYTGTYSSDGCTHHYTCPD